MKKITTLLLLVFAIQFGYSQKDQEVEIRLHTVQMGETIKLISKKYLVHPSEIYQLNKFAVDGISKGMILQIPVPVKEISEVAVVEKPVKKEVVRKAEPVIEETKQVVVAKTAVVETKTSSSNFGSNYTVEPKETLYSLSRKFGVSVDELKQSNPQIEQTGLQIGMVLKVPSKQSSDNASSVLASTSNEISRTSSSTNSNSNQTISHKVEPKETFYSLSKKYGVSADEIKAQNEAVLVNGLQIGLTLTIKK